MRTGGSFFEGTASSSSISARIGEQLMCTNGEESATIVRTRTLSLAKT
jgi:hypothetical protein